MAGEGLLQRLAQGPVICAEGGPSASCAGTRGWRCYSTSAASYPGPSYSSSVSVRTPA